MQGRVKLLLFSNVGQTSKRIHKRKYKTLKDILTQNTYEFCENSTVHGLRYIADKKLYPLERIFFAISFMAVVLASIFFIWNVFHKWKTTPFIFSINPDPTFVTDEPFPAVTFCNMNQASKRRIQGYSVYSTEYAMLQLLCKSEVNISIANNITNWNNLDKYVHNISQPCEELLLDCKFGNEQINCMDIFQPVLTEEALCCRFNMLHPKFLYSAQYASKVSEPLHKSVYKPVDWDPEKGYPKVLPKYFIPRIPAGVGEYLGFSVTLNADSDDYYCSSTNGIGFKAAIHSPDEIPNMHDAGLLLPSGYETKVRIASERVETEQSLRSIDKDIRLCMFQDERRLTYFKRYTQRNCLIECGSRMTINSCGCVRYYSPKIFGSTKTCSIYADKCLSKMRAEYIVNNTCKSCLPSCFDLTFDSEFFSTPLLYDTMTIPNVFKRNLSSSYRTKDIAVVNMYFKENSYRSSKRSKYVDFTGFLSSIGGLLGLFLGYSFLSISEIIYYALLRPYRMIHQHNKEKETINQEYLSPPLPYSIQLQTKTNSKFEVIPRDNDLNFKMKEVFVNY